MQTLVNGLHEFFKSVVTDHGELLSKLATGQDPKVLLVTCADSRVEPSWVFQSKPGSVFVVRNAGNLVPSSDHTGGGEIASIEYALKSLDIQDLVICGHTDCGAMKGLLAGATGFTHVGPWLQHAKRTKEIMESSYQHLTGTDHVTACAEENVLVQIEQLLSHDFVMEAWQTGRLRIHGWVYDVGSGEVFAYNSKDQQFRQLRVDGPQPIGNHPSERQAVMNHRSQGGSA